MKIIFMGTPEFAIPSLKILIESHHEIQAIVTTPDKTKGRGLTIAPSPVKIFSEKYNFEILQPAVLKEKTFIERIQEFNTDLIIVVAFRILPSEIFTLPAFGSVNLHASLLPKYRGAAPINWALIKGETETGVTSFFIKEKVDTGSIILQKKCAITEDDDARTLSYKLSNLGAEAIFSTVNLIEMTNGNVQTSEQNEKLTSQAPKIFTKDCRIEWGKSNIEIYNFIRGLSPHPGAFTSFNNKILKIFKSSTQTNIPPEYVSKLTIGELIKDGKKLFVKCFNSVMQLLEVQPEGRRRMNISDFLAGHKIEPGNKLI